MSILCNNCYKKLTKKELSIYPIQWQFSGDMYCVKCRTCPDDCRYRVCRLKICDDCKTYRKMKGKEICKRCYEAHWRAYNIVQ